MPICYGLSNGSHRNGLAAFSSRYNRSESRGFVAHEPISEELEPDRTPEQKRGHRLDRHGFRLDGEGICAEFADPVHSIYFDPGEGIASKSSFGSAPGSTEHFHGFLRIAGQDRKGQPINRESKCGIHVSYRTPVRNPVVRAPALPPCYQDGGCSGPRRRLSACARTGFAADP